MNQYLPELYSRSGWNVEVQINLSNYGTKVKMKKGSSIETSDLASKADLVNLKTQFYLVSPYHSTKSTEAIKSGTFESL